MKIRGFREEDRSAAIRIWNEVGWIEDNVPKEEDVLDFIRSGRAVVAEIGGEAEALATTMRGEMSTGIAELPFTGITSVMTGRVARKSGAAGAATAQAVAEEATEGAAVAALGMFEQGYYNRLGFGTGSYEHFFSFDPATLTISPGGRMPRRIAPEELEAVHAARKARIRPFGGINLDPPASTRLSIAEAKNSFGLGFEEGGELTHLLWADAKGEYGPYRISFMAYRSMSQLVELLGVLKGLGDQVRLVKMLEPAGFQIQDLLEKPFGRQTVTRGGAYENSIVAEAYWQLRILDLKRCVAALPLTRCEPVRFALELEDPINEYLPEKSRWRGIGGEYTVTLGPEPSVEAGTGGKGGKGELPRMRAGVGAFSRMLFGVLPASSLAATDRLEAPEQLLGRLDAAIRPPRPHFDWLF